MATPTPTPTPAKTLDALFPAPFQSGSSFSPTQNPGVTAEAGDALVRLLKDNHEKYHIYFNDRGFHKYVIALHVIAHKC